MEDYQLKESYVLLKRLSEEEIKKHTREGLKMTLSLSGHRRPDRKQKKIASQNLRDVSRIDFTLFDQYKRTRRIFLKKKRKSVNNHQSKSYIPEGYKFHSSSISQYDTGQIDISKDKFEKKSPTSFLGLPLENSPPHSSTYPYSGDDLPKENSALENTIVQNGAPKFRLKKAQKRKTLVIESDSDHSEDDFFPLGEKNCDGNKDNNEHCGKSVLISDHLTNRLESNASVQNLQPSELTHSRMDSSISFNNKDEFYDLFKNKYPHLVATYSKLEDPDLLKLSSNSKKSLSNTNVSSSSISDYKDFTSSKSFDVFSDNQISDNVHQSKDRFDVVSKIMQEMDDFKVKPRKKPKLNCADNITAKPNTLVTSQAVRKYNVLKKKKPLLHKSVANINCSSNDKYLLPNTVENDANVIKRLVQDIVNDVCETTCAVEKLILESNSTSELMIKHKQKCKWCETMFQTSNNDETICAICKDIYKKNKTTPKYKIAIEKKRNTITQKLGKKSISQNFTKNKIIAKVWKNLPSYDKNRLLYKEKSDKSLAGKKYNHCKTVDPIIIEKMGFANMKKIKKNKVTNSVPYRKKVAKTLSCNTKQTIVNSSNSIDNAKSQLNNKLDSDFIKNINVRETSDSDVPALSSKGLNKDNKKHDFEMKNIDRGLFLMTFPEPDKELDLEIALKENVSDDNVLIKKKQAEPIKNLTKKPVVGHNESTGVQSSKVTKEQVSGVQYGTYILPPVPTVVVANYAAGSKKGDFYLSSVYYQNETHSSKPTMLSNSSNNVDSNENQDLNKIPLSNVTNNIPQLSQITNQLSENMCDPQNCNMTLSNLDFIEPTETGSSHTTGIGVSNQPYTSLGLNQQSSLIISNVVSGDSNVLHNHEISIAGLLTGDYDEKQPKTNLSILSSEIYNPSVTTSGVDLKDTVNNEQTNLAVLSLGSENIDSSITHSSNILNNPFESKDIHEQSNTASSNLVTKDLGVTVNNTTVSTENFVPDKNIPVSTGPIENNPVDDPALEKARTISKSTNQTLHEIDAISILGVLDLDGNSEQQLNNLIVKEVNEYKKILSAVSTNKDSNAEFVRPKFEKIEKIKCLHIAKFLLKKFGSFKKVAEDIIGKNYPDHDTTSTDNSGTANLLPSYSSIKAKINIKPEREEPENVRQSCQFADASAVPSTQLEQQLKSPTVQESIPLVNVKMEKLSSETTSCSSNLSSSAPNVNHIEKIQSQIASINAPLPFVQSPRSAMENCALGFPQNVVPVVPFGAQIPSPIAPRNELANDVRETPSTGSGSRTPSRPESARSQPEESMSAVQIKKERVDAAAELLSQCNEVQQEARSPCSYSQNSNMPQVTSPITNALLSESTNFQPIPEVHRQIFSVRGPPNKTVPFNGTQNLSKVIFNVNPKQFPQTSANVNNPSTNSIRYTGQLINVQQVVLPGVSGMQQQQNPVTIHQTPSFNAITPNSYILQQTTNPSPAFSSGSSMFLNTQVNRTQNVYSAPGIQNNPVSHQIATMSNQVVPGTSFLVQNKRPATDKVENMFCAVCMKVATLRCKQCAKVAYCNTNCAKVYWHRKHKMECKPMQLGSI